MRSSSKRLLLDLMNEVVNNALAGHLVDHWFILGVVFIVEEFVIGVAIIIDYLDNAVVLKATSKRRIDCSGLLGSAEMQCPLGRKPPCIEASQLVVNV